MSFADDVAKMRAAHEKQFHDNQIIAGDKILGHFIGGIRYVQLAAQMQSGKTGCALHVAFQMLLNNQIEQVYIISGGSETELRDQWKAKMTSHFIEYSDKRGLSDEEESLIQENVMVIWRQDLKKNTEKFGDKYLIVWDESHFASTQNQTLHHFFSEIGLMGSIQGDTSSLTNKHSYILSITATRDAEQARAEGANDGKRSEGWKMVVMHPGESYRGVVDFKREDGRINQSCRFIDENKPHIISIIENYSNQKKFMVLRCSGKHEQLLEEIKVELGIDVVHYNSETKGIESHEVSLSVLEKAPSKFTLFVVKGMLRMGKELPKKHICAVFESAEKSNNNTILQGLLGRACGYHSYKIDIYLPKDFIAPGRGLDEYVAIVESDFTIGLTGTAHTPRREALPKASKGLNTNTPHHIPIVDEYTATTCTKSEKKDKVGSTFGDLHRWWSDGIIDKSRYSIEQQQEISKLLVNPDEDSICFHKTHDGSGKKLKTTDDRLDELEDEINGKRVILRGSWKPIVVWNITGNCPGTRFKKGECVITFVTKAKPLNYCAILGPKVCPTNGTDIHHTLREPSGGDLTIDVPGGQLHMLKRETYVEPELLKSSLVEAIKTSQNPDRMMIVGTQITSNYWKGGKKYKGISFSGEFYTHELLKKMLRDIGKENGVFIKMIRAPGRPPLDSGNDIRISKISWR